MTVVLSFYALPIGLTVLLSLYAWFTVNRATQAQRALDAARRGDADHQAGAYGLPAQPRRPLRVH